MRDRAYAGAWFAGLCADVADRFGKNHARANGRLGLLRPRSGSGPLVWIKADGAELSGRLAAEIARAGRARFPDRPIVLTFEEEHPAVIDILAHIAGVGYAYGPADRRAALRRALRRLAPTRVLAVGAGMGGHLAAELRDRAIPCALVHGLPHAGIPCIGFPQTAREQAAWADYPHHAAPFLALLAASQVEPVFQGIAGAWARALFWVADLTAPAAADLAVAWRASPLARHDLLFIGAPCPGAQPLSVWDRTRHPVPPGTIMWVDEERYWPALAASCTAIHLNAPAEPLLWAVLAGGRTVSAASRAILNLIGTAPVVEVASDELLSYWFQVQAEPQAARAAADALRRYFWAERRRAAAATEVLLDLAGGA